MNRGSIHENRETDWQNIHQEITAKVQEESSVNNVFVATLESDKSRLEKTDYTQSFETIDSQVNMDIGVHDNEKLSWPDNIGRGLRNIDQQDRWKREKAENVDSSHYVETTGSNLQYIVHINQTKDKVLCNNKEDMEKHKERLETSRFENADSNLQDTQCKYKADDDQLEEIMQIKQEIEDDQEQQLENTNFEDTALTIKAVFQNSYLQHPGSTSDIEQEIADNHKQTSELEDTNSKDTVLTIKAVFQNSYLEDGSSNPENIVNSCVNIDLKPEMGTLSNEESDSKFENNSSLIYMSDGNITSTLNVQDSSSFTGNLDLNLGSIGLDIDKSDINSEKVDFAVNKCVSDIEVINCVNDKYEKHERVSHFRKDMMTHSIEQPHTCNICEKGFKKMSLLRRHMTLHSNERLHKCNICDQDFKTPDSLKRHMFSHSTESPHKCSLCEKRFKSKIYLRSHMVSHTAERPHKCDICESGFKTMLHLKRHMLSHSNERLHQCDMCDKEFKTTSNLRNHMFSHTTWRPHKCDVCQTGYKTQCHLRRHMIIHSNERLHKCDLCEKDFKRMSELRSHMISHTTGERHKCNICYEDFKTLDVLKRHMFSHRTEHPHKCNICEKAFKLMCHLKYHMISHSTERPHQCNVCEKRFKTKRHLKNHMIRHTTERPHRCKMCEKEFKTISDLRRHDLICHSNEQTHEQGRITIKAE